MSSWKVHIAVGLLLTAIVWAVNQFVWNFFSTTSWKFVLVALPIVFLYAILPDCDLAGSKVTAIATIVVLLLALWQFLRGLTNRGIVLVVVVILLWGAFATNKLTHRGHIHSLLFGVIACLPLLWFSIPLAIVGFVAFFSHLFADSVTGGKWVVKLW